MHRLENHEHRRVWIGGVCSGCVLGLIVVAMTAGRGAAGPEHLQDQGAPPGQLPKPRERTASCATEGCHTSIVDRPVMHGPAAQLACLDCHEYASPAQHLFRLTKPKRDLCTGCHTLQLEANVHTPVAERDCMGCHDPHGSEHPLMLLKDPAGGLCMSCHTENYLEREYVHGPVAVEACVVCHNSHSSGNPGLLTKSPARLCFECHSELEPTGLQARHQHKPLEDGCTSCHDPHASDAKFQLEASAPELCFKCHDGVVSDLEAASVIHGPVETEGGCAQCHDPHFTELPKLQRSPQPDLCLDCHDTAVKTPDGRTLSDMAAWLEENPNHHGPVKDGNCTACHQPHAAGFFRLLFKEYPPEFYAPFDLKRYELCFSCHQADLVLEESGMGLTQFRQGDRNLHWLHVNKKKKGRTCRACHEVHASKRPFHIRESVPFGSGGWMLDINYEQSERGGSCAPACHKKRTYDRSGMEIGDPGGADTN